MHLPLLGGRARRVQVPANTLHQSLQQPTPTMLQANPVLDQFIQLMVEEALCVVQSD